MNKGNLGVLCGVIAAIGISFTAKLGRPTPIPRSNAKHYVTRSNRTEKKSFKIAKRFARIAKNCARQGAATARPQSPATSPREKGAGQ